MAELRRDTTVGGIALVIDLIYPVGSVYMTTDPDFSPGTTWGGTWNKTDLAGKFPVGFNSSDTNFSTIKKTGGASTVTLTTAQMPSHTHTFTGTAASHTHTFTGSSATTGNPSANHTHSGTTSNNGAHTHSIRYGTYGSSGGYIVLRRNSSDDSYTSTNAAALSAGGHTHTMTTGGVSAWHTHAVTAKGSNSSTSITPAGTNSSTGSGNAHNNLPPYYTVYMWHRTA